MWMNHGLLTRLHRINQLVNNVTAVIECLPLSYTPNYHLTCYDFTALLNNFKLICFLCTN